VSRSSVLPLALSLLAVSFLARAAFFGQPVMEGDQQFYLLVGDRLLQGELPYVDIWDRKPIGLFLIYAAIRALGGDGILQYQLVATLFVAATAFLVARIARETASRRAALFAGATYILWLNVFGGEGGQSPVFYNLPVAAAALLTLRAIARPEAMLALGSAAMLAMGLAMQIKYAAVFEGVYFGCALLWNGWRAKPGIARLLLHGCVWVACALLPTAAALGAYAAIGEAQAFIFANFLSVFLQNPSAGGSSLGRLAQLVALLSPLLACAALAMSQPVPGREGTQGFISGWAIASVAGVLLFGGFYSHYALPVLVPLAITAAPLLDRRLPVPRAPRMPVMLALSIFAVIASATLTIRHVRARGAGAEVRLLASAVSLEPGEAIYVFDGEPIFYLLTASPLPTRYPFPTHLNDMREYGAIGVDQLAEIGRILTSRPAYVVTSSAPRARNNPEAWAMVSEALRTDYRLLREVRVGNRSRLLYQRAGDNLRSSAPNLSAATSGAQGRQASPP
jgi:hypothetical protein